MVRPHRFLVALWLAATVPAWACRYSVRDTGFVELASEPYQLVLQIENDREDLVTLYRQTAAEALNDSNLAFSTRTDAPAGRSRLQLQDPAGRSVDLTEPGRLPVERAAIRRLIESAVVSPRREDVHREALRAYAVVVLVEGTDPADNARVRNLIQGASTSIGRLMTSMPKPVDVPPQLVAVPIAEQAAEAVLLWGLGFDPKPVAEARLVIVYGRGRRLGSPLESAVITRTALQERLALIGQDCECDLDRAWLKGPVLPGRWDRDLQQIAARTLGFDPENPMVRTEVSRIVLRGEGDKTRQRKTSSVLGLGYTEESVEADSADTSAAGDPGRSIPSQPSLSPRLSSESTETAPGEGSPAHAGPGEGSSTSHEKSRVPRLNPMEPPLPGQASARDASGPSTAHSLWVVLAGALAAAVVAGLWVARRGSGNF